MKEECYEVTAPDQRSAREQLAREPGVASVEPAGANLHVFVDPSLTSPDQLRSAVSDAQFRRITPSLEDVFIAQVRKQEAAAHAA